MTASKAEPSASQSLDTFAATIEDARKRKWADNLPEDVQEAIITSTHSTAIVVAWLRSLGHEATPSKVDSWRRSKREERNRPAG